MARSRPALPPMVGRGLGRASAAARSFGRSWGRVLAPVLATVRPAGWVALVVAVAGLVAGLLLSWREPALVGAAAAVILLLALPWLLGRTRVQVELLLDPQRVVAGNSVAASLRVANPTSGRLRAVLLDLPVGQAIHRYDLPGLAAGARHEETFTIRTERRGVIPVGPATARRADPLGLLSRDATWGGVTEVLVRPAMVPLESLGAGLLRDLEGVTSDAVSESDLAFHALREYVPGDDLRHVHWRSSAKLAGAGMQQLLVRQYLDTRRSHATFVVEDRPDAWGSPDDFETALAAVASLVGRAMLDEIAASLVVGERASNTGAAQSALDTVCRAVPGRTGLVTAAAAAAAAVPETSLLFLLGGTGTDFATFQRAAVSFAPDVRRLAIRVDPGQPSRAAEVGDLTVLHLAELGDLPGVLRWSLG
ncbi:DUF58 domain-containing protein [Nocardioides sp. DS6]|uniref:DUF58 domain-containing protein n=1 Tax=Nocardioides eburneus TaxID=3231482 RepID=A0ABV3SUZ7_9ACTN